MNIGRSTRIALAKYDKTGTWLADQLGVTNQQISAIKKNTSANSTTIARLAKAFSLKSSEFIALSESDSD